MLDFVRVVLTADWKAHLLVDVKVDREVALSAESSVEKRVAMRGFLKVD